MRAQYPLPHGPILHALLGIFQSWLRVLGRFAQRHDTNAPSFPLVVARVVFYTWRPADSGPLLDSPADGATAPGDYGR